MPVSSRAISTTPAWPSSVCAARAAQEHPGVQVDRAAAGEQVADVLAAQPQRGALRGDVDDRGAPAPSADRLPQPGLQLLRASERAGDQPLVRAEPDGGGGLALRVGRRRGGQGDAEVLRDGGRRRPRRVDPEVGHRDERPRDDLHPVGQGAESVPPCARGARSGPAGSAVTAGSFGVDEDGLGDLHGDELPGDGHVHRLADAVPAGLDQGEGEAPVRARRCGSSR